MVSTHYWLRLTLSLHAGNLEHRGLGEDGVPITDNPVCQALGPLRGDSVLMMPQIKSYSLTFPNSS